jgi:4-amino-4-deoxy-L-arabinose transferase-like glycosyltransferase
MSIRDRDPHRPAARPEEADAALARWIALAWILASFVVGWVGMGRTPFWVDESIAVFPARGILTHGAPVAPYDLDFMPWQIKFGFWDPATPLYRYSLAAVFSVFGFSELVARGFSWVVGFLALVPLHAAGRALFGRTTAWLGIALIAGSPTFGLFAREGRHHTFVLLMGSMMVWALLVAARQDAPRQRRMLWVLPLVGALLTQTIGYMALPVAALYVAYLGVRRFVSRARGGLIAAAAAVVLYATVMVVFWDTLPFFHDVGCVNRPVGCQPTPLYYVRALYEFLTPIASHEEFFELLTLNTGRYGLPSTWIAAAGPPLFVVGLLAALFRTWRWPARRAAMVWIWLLVPVSLLSTQEVKFPRFLFVWTFPIAVLIVAFGLTQLVGRVRSTGLRRAALAVVFVLLVLAPQWSPRGRTVDPEDRWSVGLLRYLRLQVWDAPADNWHGTAAKVDYLETRVRDGDEVVTSFDDAGLQYYLGRFVYGFLNSRRSDEFFTGLLHEAERRDRVVWFVDTLPTLDFCLSDHAEPVSVGCRQKYPRFYRACLGLDDAWSHRCRRVSHWELGDVR